MKSPNSIVVYLSIVLMIVSTFMFNSSLSVEHEPTYFWLYLDGISAIAVMVYMLSFPIARQRLKKNWWILLIGVAILGTTSLWAISTWQ